MIPVTKIVYGFHEKKFIAIDVYSADLVLWLRENHWDAYDSYCDGWMPAYMQPTNDESVANWLKDHHPNLLKEYADSKGEVV